jgi:hypothetical protein
MARLLIHVEGQTEDEFVREVLRDHLVSKGYHSVEARIVGNVRRTGGICPWPSARKEIVKHLRDDPGCVATTMVDYYGLPQDHQNGWPGRARASGLVSVEKKVLCVLDAIREDLAAEIGKSFDARRFVPFVVMHEFEGLLFSDCAAFSRGIDRPDLEGRLRTIRDAVATPEEINDSKVTAPSKRVQALMSGYQKPFHGILAVLEIGLSRIRDECPHFDGWLKQLESRAG